MVPTREQTRKEASPEPRRRGRQSAHSQVVRGNLSKRLSFIACLLFSFSAQAAELVPVEELGLRLAPGFRVTLYSDSDLANDIYAMTLDSRGRVVVTSPGWIRVLEDTDGDGRADKATLFAETKTGGMGMCFDGNDLYFAGDGWFSCYHDRDGDGKADGPPEKFFPLHFTEHGGHAMRKGPDGWWYLIGGNDTGFNQQHVTLPNSPIREPEAGCLLRLTPDGRNSEIIAHGFRNPYDFDFNWLGDVFTYDSDVERDFFLPWYTPTRLYHVAFGGHHGWRLHGWERSWNRPDYYADTVDILWPVGRGSPTGVTCYRHNQFPERYRDGLFVLDWTFGKVYFFPLQPDGSSYKTEPEIFLEPIGTHGFAPTDVVVAPDGSLFISIGGRKTRGAVYHIEYIGKKSADGASAKTRGEEKREPAARASDLTEVLDAPQPLDAWSRARWMPVVSRLGPAPFAQAATNAALSIKERVRAIEVLTELFKGLAVNIARSGASDPAAPIRARVAWAIGRVPQSESTGLLAPLALDKDLFVRRCALDALMDLRATLDAKSSGKLLAANFECPDKRVHQAAARLSTLLPDNSWNPINAAALGRQGKLTTTLAVLWREHGTPVDTKSVESVLSALAETADNGLRLQAVRLVMLALGDWNLNRPSVEVYTGYEPASSLKGHDELMARVLQAVRPLFPSGDAQLDAEAARLLAMLEDDDPELMSKVIGKITETSSPTADFHYLVVLSRLRAPPGKEVVAGVARTIVGLERKLQGQELRSKQMWTERLTELVAQFVKHAPQLPDELMAHGGFARPGHVELASTFNATQRARAGRLFLAATKSDPNFVWSGALVELLSALPADEVYPVLRQQWDNLGLRDAVLLQLTKEPAGEDRERFLAGLDSSQPQVVRECLGALARLPKEPSPEGLVPLLRLLRRSLTEPKQGELRAEILDLLAGQTGENFSIRESNEKKVELKSFYQPVFDRFAKKYPALAGKWDADSGDDPEKWKQILKSVAWNKGDTGRGEKIFRERGCQTCHTGWTSLGPNLAGVASRFSVEDLFDAIIYPSRDVAPLYRSVAFRMRDGQTYTGLVAFESADGVIALTGPTTSVRLDDKEIVSRQSTDQSLMPTGLLNGLRPEDLADLYRYLKSLSPAQ